MSLKIILLASTLMVTWLVATGCSAATPTATPAPAPNIVEFGTLSNSDGNVTVDAQLLDFQIGQPLVFEVAMNTHSVDLIDDMIKVSILRDDAGKAYRPTAWEGAEPGGHHREGKLKFAAMTTKPKYVELVIRDVAKVPERAFRWELK